MNELYIRGAASVMDGTGEEELASSIDKERFAIISNIVNACDTAMIMCCDNGW